MKLCVCLCECVSVGRWVWMWVCMCVCSCVLVSACVFDSLGHDQLIADRGLQLARLPKSRSQLLARCCSILLTIGSLAVWRGRCYLYIYTYTRVCEPLHILNSNMCVNLLLLSMMDVSLEAFGQPPRSRCRYIGVV